MRTAVRLTVAFALATTGILAAPTHASAQNLVPMSQPKFEVRPFVGAFVPTGARRDLLKNGPTVGTQVAMHVHPHIAVVGSFSYSSSDVKTATKDLNVFQYDVGTEIAATKRISTTMAFRPFLGAGVGGRSTDFRDMKAEAQHNLAGYASAGTQMYFGRFGVRSEVRDYVSKFKGLSGERLDHDTSNDLSLITGFSVRF